jgi:hypothetical protein
VAKGAGRASAKRVIRTRIVRMPSPADVSVVHWNLSVERTTQVRLEMDLLEGEPPTLIAQADATESYSDATAFLLVFPIFYTTETLGSATDRAARRALGALFNTAATNGPAKAQGTNP